MRPPALPFAATLLALGLTGPVQAQDEGTRPGGFEGIQSSTNAWVDGVLEERLGPELYREAVRIPGLLGSDIRMRMLEGEGTDRTHLSGGFWWVEAHGENSIDARFDWHNWATSMRVRSSESQTDLELAPRVGVTLSEQEAQDFTLYFDAAGTMYVPIEYADLPSAEPRYVPVNFPGLFGQMTGVLEVNIDRAIEAGVAAMVDRVAMCAAIEQPEQGDEPLDCGALPDPEYDRETGGWEYTDTEEALEAWVEEFREQYELLRVFPPLIHFAYVLTRDAVRSQVPVRSETITWRGQANCTRFTVTAGEQTGYILIYDPYGRLIHLRDTDGSTATYGYDRDLTVP